jgi:hypothetical protein
MTGDDAQQLGVLARLVLGALILLIIGGIAWHGITVQIILRIWHDLIERPSRPIELADVAVGDRNGQVGGIADAGLRRCGCPPAGFCSLQA